MTTLKRLGKRKEKRRRGRDRRERLRGKEEEWAVEGGGKDANRGQRIFKPCEGWLARPVVSASALARRSPCTQSAPALHVSNASPNILAVDD